MRTGLSFILLSIFGFLHKCEAKSGIADLRIHADFPAIDKDRKVYLDVLYVSDSVHLVKLNVFIYKYSEKGDSLLVLSKKDFQFTAKKGDGKRKINFSKVDSNTKYNTKFYEVFKRTNNIPPGVYKIFVTTKSDSTIIQNVFLREVDSVLSPTSPIRRDINESLLPKSKSFLGLRFNNPAAGVKSPAGNALKHSKNKTAKAAKRRGLTPIQSEVNGKGRIDLYYQDWFAGRYEIENKKPLSEQVNNKEKIPTSSNLNSLTSNSLGHPTLFSQHKKLNEEKKDNDEIKGDIGMTTNLSTGQEQNSSVDNNFYELRGRVEAPIFNLPVEFEGLYTSQDKNRKVKSSYFRIHYDVDKVKEGMKKSLTSYNTKFSETKEKNIGMEQVYTSGIHNLEAQKSKLQSKGDIGKEKNNSLIDDEQLQRSKKIAELDKKISRYKTLLDQNKNAQYFDSTLGYSKTKDIGKINDLSYKQMAKLGTNMLPDGQAKKFLSGVTRMDAGMFPKDESKYTMSGQMMKGVDFGYDMGFCEASVTIGKTEYVGRDGNLDKYTCYAVKSAFKPVYDQKISLVYYGYTADKRIISGDHFYKNINISAPGFFQPVHIVSANHTGSITKYVMLGGEVATSIKQSDKTELPVSPRADKMAYHFTTEGNIPNTAINLEAEYNKTGKKFENNTLPISLSGTEQYRLSGRNDFFKSYVTAGITYNYFFQQNFSTSGSNKKWGFDVKTNFKRYPNIALSYKPFTTFQSIADTMNIPQRPLFGSVATGKATYNIKKNSRSIRFTILYNQNVTTVDTTKYGSTLMQGAVIYANKRMMNSVTIGRMDVLGTNIAAASTMPAKSSFLSLAANYALNKKFSVAGGQDFGVASFGFCRYVATGGVVCRFVKVPITARANMRFNTYELSEGAAWKQLYSGNIDLSYRFKVKTLHKNE